ncbi:Glu-tRNA(Gln) amidotransferase subunit GatD [Candidatus Woesearchaeota archaeon]|nr:Glu-tRNA(Gln) amidotransferase subunit GatD [Candidatus Woesearchaeota archaeon]
MPNPGDRVKVITVDEELEGILMPEDKECMYLKLSSGYNIGVVKSKVKKITVLASAKKQQKETPTAKQKQGLPTITILHTGGTIASKVDYSTGAVIAKFSPEDILQLFPELQKIARIHSHLVSNLQSESLRFGHYNLMAKAIAEEIKQRKPKGIIITHGTDTMHYTAAALAFMLENISIPIILVGAQRSSDRPSSDAGMNLLCAATFIAETDFRGIAICMHENPDDNACLILPPCQSRKLHTSRRDAFKAVNDLPVAKVDYGKEKIDWLNKNYYKGKGEFRATFMKEKIKVGIFRSHTNTMPEDFLHYKNFDGLILEGTGLGHLQTMGFDAISQINEENKKALGQIIKNGCITVLTSQCIFGRVNMNVYTPQRQLLEIGVIPGEDMTTETAFIKLAWLLSNYPKEKVKELMQKNLRGEITERTDIREQV